MGNFKRGLRVGGRLVPVAVVLALVMALLCGGFDAKYATASSSSATAPMQTAQMPAATTSSGCPAGDRAITFTNYCSYDVWVGEAPAAPQLQSTPPCTKDSDCATNNAQSLEYCVNGACVGTCASDSDCGPNETCYANAATSAGTGTPGTGTKVGICYYDNFEPTPVGTATPSSGSPWQLSANGGKSVICIPEGPTSAPTGKSAQGASCTQNSDCASNVCGGGTALNELCTPSDGPCKCMAVITWGGNFWGRTQCSGADPSTNSLTCETGNCGAANGVAGKIDCNGPGTQPTPAVAGPFGGQPPVFLDEMTLLVPPQPAGNSTYNPGAQDDYDNSNVSGFNVGSSLAPVPGTFQTPASTSNCPPVGVQGVDSNGQATGQCSFDMLSTCPSQLQYQDTSSTVVGCWNPTQACDLGTSTQKSELGCGTTAANVPFLCQTAADCPYGSGGTQSMICDKQSGEAFGQCECQTSSDCPSGSSCQGTPGTCTPSSVSATWQDLYGCSGFYIKSPYNGATTTSKDTGIVCGCPSWSAAGECIAHNINWEQVPVASTSPVPSPAPTTSLGDFYLLFHNACPTSYTYAYDDAAGNKGCTGIAGSSTGPSYDITFCPANAPSLGASPPGGDVTLVTSGSGSGKPGSTISGGTFSFTTQGGVTETISSVSLSISRPGEFSKIVLTPSTGSLVEVDSPNILAITTFTFSSPIILAANATETFTVTVTLSGGATARNGFEGVAYAAAIGGETPGSGGGGHDGGGAAPWMMLVGAMMMLGMMLTPIGAPSRGRKVATFAMVVLLATCAFGCGSSGGSNPANSSTQKVTAMSVTAGGNPISVSGIPLKLGKVKKK